MKAGVTINRPPRDGHMAFVRSPDNISIEILQKGEAKAPAEPWASMPNTGKWAFRALAWRTFYGEPASTSPERALLAWRTFHGEPASTSPERALFGLAHVPRRTGIHFA